MIIDARRIHLYKFVVNAVNTVAAGLCLTPNAPTYNREKKMSDKSLYERLGGYDALVAVADNLLPRLAGDEELGRFWANRGEDGIQREKQLLVDFLASSAGGPMYYTGRDMLLSHRGMTISNGDWDAFIGHLNATLDAFQVPEPERSEVLAFIDSTRADIVEA